MRRAAQGVRPAHWVHLVLGLALWFAGFCLSYGGIAVACAWSAPPPDLGPMTWINAAVVLLAVPATAAFSFASWTCAQAAREPLADESLARGTFVSCIAAGLYAIAAVSTVVIALPAVLLPPCI